jgi:hypothetical protein
MAFRPISGIPMSSLRIAGVLAVLLALATFVSPSPAEASDTVPDNAMATRSGDGWECMTGFQKMANACSRIAVPANAHLDYSGAAWKCDRGFHLHGATCVND